MARFREQHMSAHMKYYEIQFLVLQLYKLLDLQMVPSGLWIQALRHSLYISILYFQHAFLQ